jgi:hypothetical protein
VLALAVGITSSTGRTARFARPRQKTGAPGQGQNQQRQSGQGGQGGQGGRAAEWAEQLATGERHAGAPVHKARRARAVPAPAAGNPAPAPVTARSGHYGPCRGPCCSGGSGLRPILRSARVTQTTTAPIRIPAIRRTAITRIRCMATRRGQFIPPTTRLTTTGRAVTSASTSAGAMATCMAPLDRACLRLCPRRQRLLPEGPVYYGDVRLLVQTA